MTEIRNPILPGFNPDPSFIRVGDDYFLATSSFEWFPGVPIYHSRDLVHWRMIAHALTRTSQLPLAGVPDSGGIWAPSISYDDGTFYLLYTIVQTHGGPFKDCRNYLVTADDIAGPWSEPIYLNSWGFDPSLFHDDDGRKWLVNVKWDYRPDHPRFGGIVLQEFDPGQGRLVGPVTNILRKEPLIEGPNLYKRNAWYYLMLAEGGTSWNHGISMARAKDICGPYELDPQPMVLTSRNNADLTLQRAGHGEIVETQSGEWYLAHLCARPVHRERRCLLGRETALQRVKWTDDDWLRLDGGTTEPKVVVPAPRGLQPHPWPAKPQRDDFDAATLDIEYQSLREPIDESWASLKVRPGWLQLRGRSSLVCLHQKSLLAKRITSWHMTAQTRVDFEPRDFSTAAGLICYMNSASFVYLAVRRSEQVGKQLYVGVCDDGNYREPYSGRLAIDDWRDIHLRVQMNENELHFSASQDGRNWRRLEPVLNPTILSDNYGRRGAFTGPFVGLFAMDLSFERAMAYFDYFEANQ